MTFKRTFIISLVALQLGLIFFYIYTQSTIIKLTYACQKNQNRLDELQKNERQLMHELLQLQKPQELKAYALHELGMKKATIAHIKKLSDYDK